MLVDSLPENFAGTAFIVHDGPFHAHEVFVCALHKPDFIVRTRDYQKYLSKPNIAIIDQGMELSSTMVKTSEGMAVNAIMDHHQYKGYKSIEAMFGKLGYLDGNLEFLLHTIGMNDCGEVAIDIVNNTIKSFNPSWDNSSKENYDRMFSKALEYASIVIDNPNIFIWQKSSETAREEAKIRALNILKDIEVKDGLMFLDQFMPYHEFIHDKPEIKLIAYPSNNGYSLHVRSKNTLALIESKLKLDYPINYGIITVPSFRSMMELVDKIRKIGE